MLAALSTSEVIIGICTLVPVVLGYIMALLTVGSAIRQRQPKLLLTAFLLLSIPSPWLGQAAAFVHYLLLGTRIPLNLYLLLTIWSMPFVILIWDYLTATLFREGRLLKIIAPVILLALTFWHYHSVLVGHRSVAVYLEDSIYPNTIFSDASLVIVILTLLSLVIFIGPSYLNFSVNSMSSYYRFKFRLIGLGAYAIAGSIIIDGLFDHLTNGLMVISRVLLLTSLVLLYLGYNTPSFIKQDDTEDEAIDFFTREGLEDRRGDFSYEELLLMTRLSVEVYKSQDRFDMSNYGIKPIAFIEHANSDTQAYICEQQSGTKTSLYIGFRGSTSITNAYHDLFAYLVKFHDEPGFLFKARVHQGALRSYRTISDSILTFVKEYIDLQEKDGDVNQLSIYVSGHSLGGSLATYCVYDLKLLLDPEYDPDINLYTFGSPRPGNIFFAQQFNSLNVRTYRVVNNEDMITRMPKFFYKHVGQLIFLSDGDMRINPSRWFQFLELLDNPLGIILGQAVLDHTARNYYRAITDMEEIKRNRLWSKKETTHSQQMAESYLSRI